MGPQGLKETAELCLRKAAYAKSQLAGQSRFTPAFDHPTFKEFVLRDKEGRVEELLRQASSRGFLAGLPLGRWYPELADCFLVTVTEKRTGPEIEGLVRALSN
jgi:glycine dehydrogenase subunit 1